MANNSNQSIDVSHLTRGAGDRADRHQLRLSCSAFLHSSSLHIAAVTMGTSVFTNSNRHSALEIRNKNHNTIRTYHHVGQNVYLIIGWASEARDNLLLKYYRKKSVYVWVCNHDNN